MSVLSCGSALSFELSFSDKSLCGAFMASSHCCTSERLAVLITSQGSVPATPNNPMTKGEFHISLWNPFDQKGDVSSPFKDFPSTKRAFHSPLEPSTISLRPTVRRLDTVNISVFNSDHCFASEIRPRNILGCVVDKL